MRSRVLVMTTVGCLLLSACGSRVSGSAGGAPGATELGDRGAPSVPSSGSGGPSPGAASQTFGSLPSPCGPGDAKGATDVGVTDAELRIAVVTDEGGPKPGLNKGMHDSMDAFVGWCNDQGGINGRKVALDFLDAKLLDYRGQVKAACGQNLALVGGLAALDDTGAQDGVECGIVNVPGAAVSPAQLTAPNTVQPAPAHPKRWLVAPSRWVAKTYPGVEKKAGAIWSNFPTIEAISRKQRQGLDSIGYDFVYTDKANVSETNWAPMVLAMKNEGIEYFTLTSSFEEIVPLQTAMDQLGFKPKVTELQANYYNRKYPADAGAVAEGSLVSVTVWPFEDADKNPAMQQYLETLERYVPGSQPEALGVQAFSAGLLWATAAKKLGSNVTRASLLQELRNIHEWNGGGLHGKTDPGAGTGSTCFVMMEIKQVDGEWGFVRRYPLEDADAEVYKAGNGMACPPASEAVAAVEG
jgi:ABC-type branched-subunit amino acid transport system substrate-binding protein